jgi:uncharacterized protein
MPPRPESAADELRAQQFAFAAHLRDPEGAAPPPGIEDRRLQIYRDLFYTSVEGLLAGNFPVCKRVLGEAAWHQRVRAFYRDFRAQTPLFPELGREWLRYLELRREQSADDPDWLLELAHYEWVEAALMLSEAEPDLSSIDPQGDLLSKPPVLTPLAWALAYRYPVHRIREDFQPETPGDTPTTLLVMRDAQDEVRFKEIGLLSFLLIEAIGNNPALSGETLLRGLADQQRADAETFLREGGALLEQLRARGVILGSRCTT